MSKNKIDIQTTRDLHQSGNWEAAEKNYLQILKKKPRHVEALHSLGILYAQKENFSEATKYLQRAAEFQPQNLIIRIHLANILKFQGLYAQSETLLKEVLQQDPENITALNNLGIVYYMQSKFAEAIDCYRLAIEKKPDFADAYYNMGLALSKSNQLPAAIHAYENLIAIAPEHFAARFHLACVLMQLDKLPEAIEAFSQIESHYQNHFETQTNLATCYLKQGLLNEAKKHYLKALNLTPDDTQILFNLGVIHSQLGELDEAIQFYQRLLRIQPNDFAAHNNLGAAFLAKQHFNFALQHFKEALRLQPQHAAIKHTIQVILQNKELLTSPPEYITSLFDSYADHYEPHLLTALEYKIPELLQNAIKQPGGDILDLGCGTGLCGVIFKPYAKSLTGVDLSSKMLAIAAQKDIYDDLVLSDITLFLANKKSSYDLILAGDVLVYIGDLNNIFQLANESLRSNGLFAFNTEVLESGNFKMNQSGRFLHNKTYLEQLAKKHHFSVQCYETVTTRMQNNEPVYGHLFVLEKVS